MTECRPIATRLYILDGHVPIMTDDGREWAKRYNIANRRVAEAKFGKVMVSTVFLGRDANCLAGGPPQLFETMIFGGVHDRYQQLCSTWEEADAMHAHLVAMVLSGLN